MMKSRHYLSAGFLFALSVILVFIPNNTKMGIDNAIEIFILNVLCILAMTIGALIGNYLPDHWSIDSEIDEEESTGSAEIKQANPTPDFK